MAINTRYNQASNDYPLITKTSQPR